MAKQVSGRRALSRIVDETPRPVFIVDVTRRLLYCNNACLAWLDLPESEVVGQTCHFHAASHESSTVWDGLCPPPHAFGTDACQATIWCGIGSQRIYRQAQFFRLADEPSVVLAIASSEAKKTPPAIEHTAPTRNVDELHAQLVDYYAEHVSAVELDPLIGISPAIQRVRSQVNLAAAHDAAIVVFGPAGTGTDRIIRFIATRRRARRTDYLLPMDCPSLDRELFEAVLLPQVHTSGNRRITLLLSQVDQLPAEVQPLLCAFLDDPSLRIETLCTASSELSRANHLDARLRERLSVLAIDVPPLLSRQEDIPLLVQNAVESLNHQSDKSIGGVTPNAMDRLVNHPWRRNVDELYELIGEAYARCKSSLIHSVDLPERIRLTADAELHPLNPPEPIQLDDYLLHIEKQLLERALQLAKGNRAQAARLLGIPRVRLLRRLELTQLSERPEIPFVPDDDATEA